MSGTRGVTFEFPLTQRTSLSFEGESLIEGESHLYIVEFGEYGIKVGITARPRTRLAAHDRDGRNFGRRATRGWLSPPHTEAAANEEALIAYCARLTGRSLTGVRSEYSRAPFDRIKKFAASRPMTRSERPTRDENCDRDGRIYFARHLGGRHCLLVPMAEISGDHLAVMAEAMKAHADASEARLAELKRMADVRSKPVSGQGSGVADELSAVYRVDPVKEVLTQQQCERIFKALDFFHASDPGSEVSHHLATLLDLIDELIPRDASDALDFDYVFWQAGDWPYELPEATLPKPEHLTAPGTGAA